MKTKVYFKIVFIISAFLFFSCGSVPSFNAPIKIPADIMGTVHAGNPVSAEENALLDELGIQWVRNDFYWDQIEPEYGVWRFDKYDKMVKENKDSGRKILAILSFDVPWIHENGKRKDYISEKQLPYYLEYVEKVVSRYKGQVDAYEIWNEPNLHFRFWNGTNKEFYALTKAAAQKIRECDENVVIVGGSFLWSPASFIRGMWKYGAMENLDALSMHPYGMNPERSLSIYLKFEKILREINFNGEVWITEIGYPVAGVYPSRVPKGKFSDYIIKTVTLLAAKGVRTIFWYQLTDYYTEENTPKTIDSEAFFGLAFRDLKKRQGTAALGEIVSAIAGSEFINAEYNSKGKKSFYFKKEDGRQIVVSWNKNETPKIEDAPLF